MFEQIKGWVAISYICHAVLSKLKFEWDLALRYVITAFLNLKAGIDWIGMECSSWVVLWWGKCS